MCLTLAVTTRNKVDCLNCKFKSEWTDKPAFILHRWKSTKNTLLGTFHLEFWFWKLKPVFWALLCLFRPGLYLNSPNESIWRMNTFTSHQITNTGELGATLAVNPTHYFPFPNLHPLKTLSTRSTSCLVSVF